MNISKQREIWFDGREIPLEQDAWSLVSSSPVRKIVVTADQRRNGHFPLKAQLITEVGKDEELKVVSEGETVFSQKYSILKRAKELGYKTGIYIQVRSGDSLEKLAEVAAEFDYAVVDFDLPTNIPLELFIARLQKKETVLIRRVNTVEEMKVAFGVMEEGSDGVLFSGTALNEIAALSGYLNKKGTGQLELSTLVVDEVRYVGLGMRACIDTTGLMTRDEGMLVGSTSAGGILVCSETHYLPYMNLRPFRVNAGAVHSYIWMPDDTAGYLTELAAGSRVICVNVTGQTRELTVGRIKIEARPLLLIKGKSGNTELNVIVQDDWHIRVMGADGKPKNATLIRPGDELLCHLAGPGRHVGIAINETIIER